MLSGAAGRRSFYFRNIHFHPQFFHTRVARKAASHKGFWALKFPSLNFLARASRANIVE